MSYPLEVPDVESSVSHAYALILAFEQNEPASIERRLTVRGFMRYRLSNAHPHSLKPHTWHFTHPSANSSELPQSGHCPMNDCAFPSNAICSANSPCCCPAAAPWCPFPLAVGDTDTSGRATTLTPLGGVAPDDGVGVATERLASSRSCCTPCFSFHHSSSAMPIASGTDITLFGPSPIARSLAIPRSWRWTSMIGIPERRESEIRRPSASASDRKS